MYDQFCTRFGPAPPAPITLWRKRRCFFSHRVHLGLNAADVLFLSAKAQPACSGQLQPEAGFSTNQIVMRYGLHETAVPSVWLTAPIRRPHNMVELAVVALSAAVYLHLRLYVHLYLHPHNYFYLNLSLDLGLSLSVCVCLSMRLSHKNNKKNQTHAHLQDKQIVTSSLFIDGDMNTVFKLLSLCSGSDSTSVI